MARVLGCDVARVYDEHAAESRYSLDVFAMGLFTLPRHEARYVLRKIAREVGGIVLEDPSCLEESL